MEILYSSHEIMDVRDFLYNMSHYVLAYNVEFKDGQTCGTSEEERIAITFSEGKFVAGETFKLVY